MAGRVQVVSDVAGTVWKVEAAEGAMLAAGDVIVILESMKMEIPIEAPCAGRLATLSVAPNQAVAEGDVVAEIEDGG